MPQIVINKTAYDFHNCEVTIVGTTGVIGIVDGLEAISHKATFDRQKMRGSSRLAQDYTDGEADYEGAFSLQKYWWDYIVDFTNAAGLARATMEMTFSVNFSKPGFKLQNTTFWRCRFKDYNEDYKRATDTVMVPVSLDIIDIFKNGINDFGQRLG
jgi:hypothetical protein